MNAFVKTLANLALCATLMPVAAGAQTPPNPPAGITVVGTGTATVTDWVQEVSLRYTSTLTGGAVPYDACGRAIAALNETVKDLGLPPGAVVASAVVYTTAGPTFGDAPNANAAAVPAAVARVQVPPATIARFIAATSKAGWKATLRLVPRDAAAAKDSAYQAAFTDARNRATVIAAADGRHVGKLLNVTPGLGDYFGSMMASLASFAEMLGKGSILNGGIPEVTQSATFTFELTP
jgi:uncharacterized protein YggE